eukprot:CAMPEP_0196662886 /NCGR_PEP_ID=MMETSP1086-20130531/50717_1 /TAXON_ID=77921 /ORGANISM="Cyanoptyche  gloeocystis , Strain SAG4.97" /LENGTH=66 /DNA_ID=CAMNT_0041998505 /DNA_START=68 /DNA_END=268 /DNA_ORIENTATION=+
MPLTRLQTTLLGVAVTLSMSWGMMEYQLRRVRPPRTMDPEWQKATAERAAADPNFNPLSRDRIGRL